MISIDLDKNVTALVGEFEPCRLPEDATWFFLSHSFEDIGVIRDIRKTLIERGYGVWLAEVEILLGQRIAKGVQEGFQRSDRLVAYFTRHSLKSRWVLKEIGVATENMKKPVTLIVDTLEEENKDIHELFCIG